MGIEQWVVAGDNILFWKRLIEMQKTETVILRKEKKMWLQTTEKRGVLVHVLELFQYIQR